jgi:hypothetical protein
LDKNTKNLDTIDLITYEIHCEIIRSIFGYSSEDNKWNKKAANFNVKSILFLFSWPLIIVRNFLFPNFELELLKSQYNLMKCLQKNFCFNEIFDQFSKIFFGEKSNLTFIDIEEAVNNDDEGFSFFKFFNDSAKEGIDKYSEIFNVKDVFKKFDQGYKEISIDLLLGGKPNSKNRSIDFPEVQKRIFYILITNQIIQSEGEGQKIVKGVFYYYALLFTLASNLEYINDESILNGDQPASISKEYNGNTDIEEVISIINVFSQINNNVGELLISNCIDIFITFGSYIFSDAIKFFIEEHKNIFLKNGFNEVDTNQLHYFYKNNPNYFASIFEKNMGDKANNEKSSGDGAKNYIIDTEKNIKILKEFDYKLDFWITKDLSNGEYSGSIFFNGGKEEDCFEDLLKCLSEIAYSLSYHIYNYTKNYKNFIANAESCIDQNLDLFLENIETIQSSYYLFNEYLEHSEFARAVESLDMELGYKCIEETRKDIKKKRKSHLSPELIQNLITANNEIAIIFNHVQRKHDAHKSQKAKEFFKDNPNYFEVITFDDIKDVDFSSDPNGIRNARRKIFSIIAGRFGKEIAGSKITKELVFE